MDHGSPRRQTGRGAIVTFGEAMLRLTGPAGHRLEAAGRLEAHVAGAEANVAGALARLGVPAVWISSLPANPLGDRVAAELAAAGVDLTFVQRPPNGRLGLFFVEQGSAPRAARVWYDRRGSSFTRMNSFDETALRHAGFAVVSGITPALGSRTRDLAQSFFTRAREAGARLCLDVNYRALLWRPAAARRGLAGLIDDADVVVCSERDAHVVFGVRDDGLDAAKSFARAWAPRAELVVLTLGERGSVLGAGDATFEQPAFAAGVVDRFGAGDAFFAGLLWGLWHGVGHAEALRSAAMLASLKCTTVGDLARFSSADLRSALSGAEEGWVLR